MTAAPAEFWLQLPIARPPLSENSRMHWAPRGRARQQLANDTMLLARHQKLPRGNDTARITLVWNPPDRQRRDTDNPTPTLKACIDALVKYGLVADDSSRYVESRCVIGEVRKPGQVWLRIEVQRDLA